MTYKHLSFAFLLFFGVLARAQQTGDISANTVVFPPSPNATAISKFGNIPVGKYTGTPSISVPLYSFVTGNFNVQLALSYHAGGIRVGEIASNIGLGWALSGIGSISRTMRGVPDESPNGVGMLNHQLDMAAIAANPDPIYQRNIFGLVNDGNLDLQLDHFNFNFLGRSGRFILDRHTKRGVLIDNDMTLKIEFVSE